MSGQRLSRWVMHVMSMVPLMTLLVAPDWTWHAIALQVTFSIGVLFGNWCSLNWMGKR